MTEIAHALRRCGNCDHAKAGEMTKQDLNQRVCYGVPPTPIALPVQGGVQIRGFRPPVAVSEVACGQWRERPGAAAAFTLPERAE